LKYISVSTNCDVPVGKVLRLALHSFGY
jgi:hypothetical protein